MFEAPKIDATSECLSAGRGRQSAAVPAQNSISCEIRLRRVRGDEMHELSRTPIIPDRAGQSGQLVVAMGILHAMAWPATQGPASEIAQPAKVDQAARRS